MDTLPMPTFGFNNGDTIENLKLLRRQLCAYMPPASDNRCDCKFVQKYINGAQGGENTGCCEIRQAIEEIVRLRAEVAKLKD